jgi:hypothetical protein
MNDHPNMPDAHDASVNSKNDIQEQFRQIQLRIFRRFKKNPDINALLFLIGIRELGQVKKKFTKDEKVALMHIATCKLLSYEGYYALKGFDEEGWPHWIALKPVPTMSLDEQELLLKRLIIRYFAEL